MRPFSTWGRRGPYDVTQRWPAPVGGTREQFKDDYRIPTEEKKHEFLRQGRGVSFHEFYVAIGTHEVEASFSSYYGLRHTLLRSPRAARFKKTLCSVRPDLHDGWFEPSLDIMLRKG